MELRLLEEARIHHAVTRVVSLALMEVVLAFVLYGCVARIALMGQFAVSSRLPQVRVRCVHDVFQ